MRPRTEAALALGVVAVLLALAAALGARGNRDADLDLRPSTFLAGPLGARGLAEGLSRLGLTVRRSRRLLGDLAHDSVAGARTILAVIDPSIAISGVEQEQLLEWSASAAGGDMLLAGAGARGLMRCFGFAPDPRDRDDIGVARSPDGVESGDPRPWPRVSAVLASASATVVTDSSRVEDAGITRCVVPPIERADTLLMSLTGRVIALRLWREDVDRRVLLLSDETLLRNRALRESPAGAFALGLFAGRYDRVVFDEQHQGFGPGGSLAEATFGWSLRSPWGWAAWQLAITGLLALAASAIRFGPVRSVISRRRRSPLEHVRALATALAAARGHDVAIGSIVQGLHRRLHTSARRGRVEWRGWVDRLAQQLRSSRARDAARTLQSLTRPGQPPEGVLRAANAVEDVWEELRP